MKSIRIPIRKSFCRLSEVKETLQRMKLPEKSVLAIESEDKINVTNLGSRAEIFRENQYTITRLKEKLKFKLSYTQWKMKHW